MFWVVGKTFAQKVLEQKGRDYDLDMRRLEQENELLRRKLRETKRKE